MGLGPATGKTGEKAAMKGLERTGDTSGVDRMGNGNGVLMMRGRETGDDGTGDGGGGECWRRPAYDRGPTGLTVLFHWLMLSISSRCARARSKEIQRLPTPATLSTITRKNTCSTYQPRPETLHAKGKTQVQHVSTLRAG